MWAAHLLYHAAAASTWTIAVQIVLLDAGVLLTLYVILRIAEQFASRMRQTVAIAAPWAVLAVALFAAGVWIVSEPMPMRGMMQ